MTRKRDKTFPCGFLQFPNICRNRRIVGRAAATDRKNKKVYRGARAVNKDVAQLLSPARRCCCCETINAHCERLFKSHQHIKFIDCSKARGVILWFILSRKIYKRIKIVPKIVFLCSALLPSRSDSIIFLIHVYIIDTMTRSKLQKIATFLFKKLISNFCMSRYLCIYIYYLLSNWWDFLRR